MLKKFFTSIVFSAAAVLSAAPEKVVHLAFNKAGEYKDLCGNVSVSVNKKAKAPVWQPDGVKGGCLEFDGSSSLRIAPSKTFKFAPNESFAIELCYRPEMTKKDWGMLLHFYGPKRTFWDFSAAGGIGRPMFTAKEKKTLRLLAKYQNMLRKWHRIAAVRDAKTRRIYFYLDGRKIKEGDDTFAKLFNSPPGSLVIGENFKGRIDEIIVWKGLKTDFAPAKVFKARIVPLKTDANVAASWKTLKEKKLDIVPAPKNLKITGKAFPFVPGQWRVARLSKNDAAGAAEFEAKLARIGLAKPGSGKKIIKAGLYDEMKAELAKAKAPAKPMRQGYVLIADKEQILLAGSDREG